MEAGRIAIDALLVLILVGAAITDFLTGKVWNVLTYPAIGCGFVLNAVVHPAGVGLGSAALGFAVAFVPMLLGFLAGGIGGGDVKLMGAVGAFLGFDDTVIALLCVFLTAVALVAAWVLIHEGFPGLWIRVRHALGGVPDEPREERLRFPFAGAVLVGVVWALLTLREGYGLFGGPSAGGA